MKVVCIDNYNPIVYLTLGRVYDVIESKKDSNSNEYHMVLNNVGDVGTYRINRFELLSVSRDRKMELLGI